MTAPDRSVVSERLRASRVIAVLRATTVDDLLPVCDVLVEEQILSLEFTLTTPGLLTGRPDSSNGTAPPPMSESGRS